MRLEVGGKLGPVDISWTASLGDRDKLSNVNKGSTVKSNWYRAKLTSVVEGVRPVKVVVGISTSSYAPFRGRS